MNREPKYAQVKKVLREHIRLRYPAGSKLPSTAQLHREIGVSPGTVNRAIRDLVDEGLIERFERRGTFVASRERPTTKDIGFVWPGVIRDLLEDAYRGTVLHAAQEEAESREKHVLVGATREMPALPFTGENRNKVCGVILLWNHEPAVVKAYHDEGLPVVLLDPFVRMAGVPFVTSDHYAAAREATLHLTALGHRRIIYVGLDLPMSSMPVRERVLGYQEAMQEAGLDDDAHVHSMPAFRANGLETEQEANARKHTLAAEFLQMLKTRKPTACACFNDFTAFWVVQTCHEHDVDVPGELSVVGINDDAIATHTRPPLTTVHLQMEEAGRVAVKLLDSLVDENRLNGGGEILPVHLVERASTKPVSTSQQT